MSNRNQLESQHRKGAMPMKNLNEIKRRILITHEREQLFLRNT